MARILAYVAEHPGAVQREVARACGPNGSEFYGYRALRRALAAGLVVAVEPDHAQRRERRVYPASDLTPTVTPWGATYRARFAAGDVYADHPYDDAPIVTDGLRACARWFVRVALAAVATADAP